MTTERDTENEVGTGAARELEGDRVEESAFDAAASVERAWRWATFMLDGCQPPQIDDLLRAARVEAFAIGRLGHARWAEVRGRVWRHRFDRAYPKGFKMPEPYDWHDLLRDVVRAETRKETET